MTHRKVQGLLHAQQCLRPECIPQGRARGVKAQGLRYEAEVAAAVKGAEHGLWFRFRDANGPGYCNPDLILDHGDHLLVLEVKLTWTPAAERQIRELYKPVLELALGKQVRGLVVCRNLRGDTPRDLICHTLPAASEARPGAYPVLHLLRPGCAHLEADPSLRRLVVLAKASVAA